MYASGSGGVLYGAKIRVGVDMETLEIAMARIASVDAAIVQKQSSEGKERALDECVAAILVTCERVAAFNDNRWKQLREGLFGGRAHAEGLYLKYVLEKLERVLMQVKQQYVAEKGPRFNKSDEIAQSQVAVRMMLDKITRSWPFIDMKQLEASQSSSAEVWRGICPEKNGPS